MVENIVPEAEAFNIDKKPKQWPLSKRHKKAIREKTAKMRRRKLKGDLNTGIQR